MKIPFGKYKGVDLVFINSNYLRWLLDQDWFLNREEYEVLAVEDELNKRDADSSHFYEDKVNVPGSLGKR